MSLPFRSPWCAIAVLPLLTVAPLRAADASTFGRESPAIALWSQPAHAEVSAATDGLGLVAYHIHGIERVEFRLDERAVATVTTETRNASTGELEYVCPASALKLTNGAPFALAARVFPRQGLGIVTEVASRPYRIAAAVPPPVRHVDAARGDDAQGDGTEARPFATIAKAIAAATGGDDLLLHDGAYALTAEADRKFERFVTLRPAPGAQPRITSGGNLRCGMLKFVDLWFDWRANDSDSAFGGYSAPHYWFVRCRFEGAPGRFDNYTRAIKLWGRVTNLTVEGCTFRHLDKAIAAPPHAILRGNEIADLTSDAFNFCGDTLITGNRVHGLKAPRTYALGGAAEPFDFGPGAEFAIHHRETATVAVYRVSLTGTTAQAVAEQLNAAFRDQKPKDDFGLQAEAEEGRVKIVCRRTNYVQHLFVEGPANRALRFACEGADHVLKGSGQHADVFQYWGGAKERIIIRNNRCYDNAAQQWLAQQDKDAPTSHLAFVNNLLDAWGETGWSVMLDGVYTNVLFEFNTVWNSTQSLVLRAGMTSHDRNRDVVVRNNLIGIGTGFCDLNRPGQFLSDYNVYDYYRQAVAARASHSLDANPGRKNPTESKLFERVQYVEGEGRADFVAPDGDFNLAPGSMALDAGSTASGIAYDLEWKPRDARPDVGAFERAR